MLKQIVTWFRGYVCVIICGYFPERFLNLCGTRKIKVWNVGRKGETCFFSMSVKDYKKLRPVVRKTKTRPKIIKKKGLPFLLHRLRPRVGLWMGAFLFCGLIYAYSLFIWSIEITGEYTHTEPALKKYLKTLEVVPGTRKSRLDCMALEEAIRREYKDIGWVSAEIRGSKMFIRIKETNLPKPREEEGEPAHLIAPQEGEIASVIVRRGTIAVHKGDVVKAGDILINGVVDIVGDNELLVRKEAVEADGDVYLNTWFSYQKEYPRQYKKKNYTGRIKKKYTLRLLNYEISLANLLNSLENWKQYDIIEESCIKCLPFELWVKEYREYEWVDAVYSEDEITKTANAWFSAYLKELEDKKIKLLENQVRLKMTAKKCMVSGKLYVSEPVRTYRKITDSEWRNMETDEYSGNNN